VIIGSRQGVEKAEGLLTPGPCGPVEADDSRVHVLYLEYADSRNITKLLKPAIPMLAGLGQVKLTADTATNSLVVQGTDKDFAALKSIVVKLDVTFPPREFSLPGVVVETLFSVTGEDSDTVSVYCHVVEGSHCFEVPEERIDAYQGMYDVELETQGFPRELSRLIIMVIGYKFIEHARGNGVKLRCRRGATCSIDWGWGGGWESIPIDGSH
jgi:hypothetical protein